MTSPAKSGAKSGVKSPAQALRPGHVLTLANVADGAEALVVSDMARAVAAKPNPPAISLAVVCRDGPRMAQLARALEFFAPDLPVMQFPHGTASPMIVCRPMAVSSPSG
jgi:transcription-repair coupling factor (superfamily II helicase)